MPAKARYAPIAVQVREHLERARAAGLPFDEAWAEIFRAPSRKTGAPVRFPHQTDFRHSHIMALESTQGEWRAAYELRPSRLSVALERLATAQLDDATSPARRHGEESARLALVPLPTPSSAALTSEQRAMAAA